MSFRIGELISVRILRGLFLSSGSEARAVAGKQGNIRETMRPSSLQSFSATRTSPEGLAQALGALGIKDENIIRETGQG